MFGLGDEPASAPQEVCAKYGASQVRWARRRDVRVALAAALLASWTAVVVELSWKHAEAASTSRSIGADATHVCPRPPSWSDAWMPRELTSPAPCPSSPPAAGPFIRDGSGQRLTDVSWHQ